MVSETIPMSTPKLHFDSTFYLPDMPVYLTNSKEQIKMMSTAVVISTSKVNTLHAG